MFSTPLKTKETVFFNKNCRAANAYMEIEYFPIVYITLTIKYRRSKVSENSITGKQ